MFSDKVIILITIYDNIKGWDIDNKFIKPISDALISSGVIQDDNIDKMFYAVKGEFSENPHTEVCITNANNSIKILENYIS
jgi:Holliday junction resolvase RusA-like endonuclease